MELARILRRGAGLLSHPHQGLKSFEDTVREAGGIVGGLDIGMRVVPVEKVVGSVSRAHNLRSDFFYNTRPRITERYVRIGRAMQAGRSLPPVELYKIRSRRHSGEQSPVSEYYVVDGHHRVAMARKLGQAFLDAHVVQYRLAEDGTACSVASPKS